MNFNTVIQKRLADHRDSFIHLGLTGGIQWELRKLAVRLSHNLASRNWQIWPRSVQHPLVLRGTPSSDLDVFRQIFLRSEYQTVIEMLDSPRFVIDAGANVGYASALFLSTFPKAKVVSVEPDSRNFDILRQNLRHYGDRSIPVLGALWPDNRRLKLSRGRYGDGRDWATQVKPADTACDEEVRGYTVSDLLSLAGEKSIDLMKIDIEGSESDLFSGELNWLNLVNLLSIELHGEDCKVVVLNNLPPENWRHCVSGEFHVFSRR